MKRRRISLRLRHNQYIIYVDPFRKCGDEVNDLRNIFTLKWFITFIHLPGPFQITLKPDV